MNERRVVITGRGALACVVRMLQVSGTHWLTAAAVSAKLPVLMFLLIVLRLQVKSKILTPPNTSISRKPKDLTFSVSWLSALQSRLSQMQVCPQILRQRH